MAEVGDWRAPTLTVDPADGTTDAALTVVAPDGTTTTPAVTGGSASWAGAAYELTAAGEWVERWTVTGMGKGVQETTVLVAPLTTTAPTGARVYATTTDYANHLHTAPPSGARRALLEASRVVDEMLLSAVYDVDDDDLPTDADVIIAMRDATCAQAEYARASGDTNTVGAGALKQFSIGALSATRGTADGATSSPLPSHWSPSAYRILSQAALTGQPPWGY